MAMLFGTEALGAFSVKHSAAAVDNKAVFARNVGGKFIEKVAIGVYQLSAGGAFEMKMLASRAVVLIAGAAFFVKGVFLYYPLGHKARKTAVHGGFAHVCAFLVKHNRNVIGGEMPPVGLFYTVEYKTFLFGFVVYLNIHIFPSQRI